MKKILSAFLVCVLLVGTVFALVSCGGISGTYEFSEDGMSQTLKFSGKNLEVTMTYEDETETIKYTYELNDDETKITLTMTEEAINDMKQKAKEAYAEMTGTDVSAVTDEMISDMIDGITEPETMDFEKGEDYVKIDDVKYTKKK